MQKKNVFDIKENDSNVVSMAAKQLEHSFQHYGTDHEIPIPKYTVVRYHNMMGLAGDNEYVTATFLQYLGEGAYQFTDDHGRYFVILQHSFTHGFVKVLHVPDNN